jgi:hypothetical protein
LRTSNLAKTTCFVCLFVCLSVPPSIYPPGDEIRIVSANQSESLSCFVSGYPPPRIQWHRNGVHVSSDKRVRYVLCMLDDLFLPARMLAAENTCIPVNL